jgi:hypothetical protein
MGFTAPNANFPADCRAVAADAKPTSILDPPLRLPRPQRVPQRLDAEAGNGGLGAKGG